MSAKSCLLVGDIGGTHARFAVAESAGPGFERERTFECADFTGAEAAIEAYLSDLGLRPSAVCLAAAGPIVAGEVRFTNNSWRLSEAELSRHLGGIPVELLNDFEAIAYAIPLLGSDALVGVGDVVPVALGADDYTVGIIGPGTGLGVAGLCRRSGRLVPIMGEGGHLGFAPASPEQIELLRILVDRFGRVSYERLLSGPGIENVYSALGQRNGERGAQHTAAEIFTRSERGGDALASEAVDLFFTILGQAAGDVALLLGARQGIYIAGGIVQRYPALLAKSRFRSAFEDKGRHRALVQRIPTSLVTHANPGLLGASYRVLEILRAAG